MPSFPDSVFSGGRIYRRADKLYRVMWDWERDDFTGDILRPNLPCVFRLGDYGNTNNHHYTKLNKEWQFFWLALCAKVVYNKTLAQLTSLEYDYLAHKLTSVGANTTAFMNDHGLDVFRNWLLGERLGDEDPSLASLVCGGASVSGESFGDYLRVYAFDGNNPPPLVSEIDPYQDPRVFFATTITSVKIGNGYKVNKFSQFDGKDVPVPIVISKPIYFPMKYLVPVLETIKASPYYP